MTSKLDVSYTLTWVSPNVVITYATTYAPEQYTGADLFVVAAPGTTNLIQVGTSSVYTTLDWRKETAIGAGSRSALVTAVAALVQPTVAGVATGTIQYFAMASVPSGWLDCDGSAVSRTTYADLFAVIGEDYGAGDGSTTFNVPDLRGLFLRGVGTHGSIPTGANALTIPQATSLIQHTHNYFTTNFTSGPTGSGGLRPTSNTYTASLNPNAPVATNSVETRPPNMSMTAAIRT